jgi:DNA-binding GntR family transcriptional regulator
VDPNKVATPERPIQLSRRRVPRSVARGRLRSQTVQQSANVMVGPGAGWSRYTSWLVSMLRETIANGSPTSCLVGADIAARLSVSRRSIEAALSALERDGIAARSSDGESLVVQLGRRDLADLTVVRCELECTAARWAIRRNAGDRALLAAMVAQEAQPRARERHIAELDFHFALMSMAESRHLLHAWLDLAPIMALAQARAWQKSSSTERNHRRAATSEVHAAIVDAVSRQDVARAVGVLRTECAWTCLVGRPSDRSADRSSESARVSS